MLKCKLFFFFIYNCWLLEANSEEIASTTGALDIFTAITEIITTVQPEGNDDVSSEIESRGYLSEKTGPEILPIIKIHELSGLLEGADSIPEDSVSWTFVGVSDKNVLTLGQDFNATSYLRLECVTIGNASLWTHDGLEVTAFSTNLRSVALTTNFTEINGFEVEQYSVTIILGTGKGVQEKDSGNFSCIREDDRQSVSSFYVYIPEERKSVSPCEEHPCGLNTICEVRHGNRSCNCLKGYVGNANNLGCRLECSLNSDCAEGFVCIHTQCVDPCVGACGENTFCQNSNTDGFNIVPGCNCLRGYEGDPYDGCVPIETGFRFERKEEVDLCLYCGVGADCLSTMNRSLICRCKRNLKGDPYTECKRQEGTAYVSPCGISPCGENAYCEEKYGRAICHCVENYFGDPWTKCHAECLRREHCKLNETCIQAKCKDACDGACGTGANCTVSNHVPLCTCPEGLIGDPHRECTDKTE